MKKKKICLVGLGYVGLPLAVAFAEKFQVIGFDISSTRIQELEGGHDITLEIEDDLLYSVKSNINYISDIQDAKDCNIYIVTVPTPIDKVNRPDLTPLIESSKAIGTVLSKDNIVIFNSESEGKLDKKVLDEIASLQTQMKGLEGKLTTDEGKQMFNDLKTKLESFEKRVEASETGKKSAEENAIKLSADNEKLTGEVDSYKKKEEDAMVKLKAEKTSNFVADLKKNGKITPAVEEELTMFLNSLDDSDEALEFTTKLQGGGDVKQKFTRLETAKRILSRLSKVVEFGELAGGDTDLENPEGGKLDNFVEIQGTTYQVDGLAEEKAIQQYMVENKVGELEATRVILDAKEKRENK